MIRIYTVLHVYSYAKCIYISAFLHVYAVKIYFHHMYIYAYTGDHMRLFTYHPYLSTCIHLCIIYVYHHMIFPSEYRWGAGQLAGANS